jgi:type I restriction enzyme S subunit
MTEIIKKKFSVDKSKWNLVNFEDVVIESREIIKNDDLAKIKYIVGLEHLDSENYELKRFADPEKPTTFRKRFLINDVLFGRRRAYLKKAAQAKFSGICSGDITVMRAKENLSSELLPFIVNNDNFFDYAVKHSAGGLSPRVKFKDLAKYNVLLPPKEEQTKLAELFWSIDKTTNCIECNIKSLNEYFFSLIEFFVKDTKNFINFADVKSEFFKGITNYNREPGNLRLLPSGCIFPRKLKKENIKNFYSTKKNDRLKKLIKGDILFNSGGVGTLGRSHFFNLKDGDYFSDSFVINLRIRDTEFINKFIYYIFQSKSIQKQIIQHTKGTTGITSISKDGIDNFKIPKASIDIQKQLVKKLEKIESLIDLCYDNLETSKILKKLIINNLF